MHQHAVVWLDHRRAQVIRFGETGVDTVRLWSRAKDKHLHHKANSIGDGRAASDTEFFKRIVGELNGARSILIGGPSGAKNELVSYMRGDASRLAKAIRGVEPLQEMSDGELLRFARPYLTAADRIRPGL